MPLSISESLMQLFFVVQELWTTLKSHKRPAQAFIKIQFRRPRGAHRLYPRTPEWFHFRYTKTNSLIVRLFNDSCAPFNISQLLREPRRRRRNVAVRCCGMKSGLVVPRRAGLGSPPFWYKIFLRFRIAEKFLPSAKSFQYLKFTADEILYRKKKKAEGEVAGLTWADAKDPHEGLALRETHNFLEIHREKLIIKFNAGSCSLWLFFVLILFSFFLWAVWSALKPCNRRNGLEKTCQRMYYLVQ